MEKGLTWYSVTTSVMQFPYNDCLVNLLDTLPGHEDFSEKTYRKFNRGRFVLDGHRLGERCR